MPYTPYQRTDNGVSTVAGGSGGLGTPLNPSDTTLRLPTGDGAKFPATPPFMLYVGGSELVKATLRSSDTVTIARAQEGTSAGTWPVGTTVELVETATTLAHGDLALQRLVQGIYNVRDATYGAVGDGVTDDRAAIQAALDDCRAAGGGVVYVPGSTSAYLINSCPAHPLDSGVSVSLVMGANTTLRGDGPGATILKFGTSIPNQGRMLCNYNRLSPGGDTRISIVDIEFDGAAAAQTGAIDAQYGLQLIYARATLYRNVYAHDFYGSTSGGNGAHGTPGESWHLDVHNSTDCRFTDCIVADTGSNKTAAGFEANSSTGVALSGCKAYGMKFSRGFTNWHCSVVQFVNCHSYDQQAAAGSGGDGFNSEFSLNVEYVNCVSGASSSDQATYPFSASTSLGNNGSGFRCDNAEGPHFWTGCIARSNGGSGIVITNGGSGLLYQVNGGIYRANSAYGVDADSASGPLLRTPGALIANNTTGQLRYDGTNASATVGTLTVPSVPSSTTVFTNPFPFDVQVIVSGGTVTQIQVYGTTIASSTTTPVVAMLAPQQTIKITYSVAPSWVWCSLL